MTSSSSQIRDALKKEREMVAELEQKASLLSRTLDSLENELKKEKQARDLLKERIVAAAGELARRAGQPPATAVAANTQQQQQQPAYGIVPPEFKAQYGRVEDEEEQFEEEEGDDVDNYARLPPPTHIYGDAMASSHAAASSGARQQQQEESHYGAFDPALAKVLASAKSKSGAAAQKKPVVESMYDAIPAELGGKTNQFLLRNVDDADDDNGDGPTDEPEDLARVPELAQYYCGATSRAIAEEILKTKPPDSFLLRDSSRPKSYAISFVDDDKQIKHNLIRYTGSGYVLQGESDVYPTVSQLLVSYGFN